MTTRFTDDFSSATWATNWTTNVTGTSATITVVTGEGKITLPNGSARYVYAVDNVTASANQEVLVKVRGDQTTSRNNTTVIGVAMSGTFTSGRPTLPADGAYLIISGTSNTFSMNHVHSGAVTNGPALTASRAAFNSTFWVRLKHDSGTVYIRTWTDGASEPGTWTDTVDISGSAALPAGKIVLGAETTSATNASEGLFFDDITATDVTAPVHGGYTAQPMTASLSMPGGEVPQGRPSPMTASFAMPNAVGRGNAQTGTILADTYTKNDFQTTNFGSQTTAQIGLNFESVQYQTALIKASQPDLQGDETLVSANLTLKAAFAWPADTYEVYRITSDWVEGTVTHNTKPSMTLLGTVAIPAKAAGDLVTINIASVFNATNYGVALMRTVNGGTGSQFYTKEHATSTNRPTLTFALGDVQDASVPATPATFSALMVDPTVTTTIGASVAAQPMTASLALVQPAVTVISHIEVTPEPMSVQVDMPGGGFAVPVTVLASPAEATMTFVDPVVTTQRGPIIHAAPMTSTITLKQPEAVNGLPIVLNESEDAYYGRVNTLGPESWWRLNDVTSTAIDRIEPSHNGTYVSVLFGQHNGPEGRASATFDGDGYIQGGTETAPVPGTLEFSFRTTRANSYLMYSADDKISGLNLAFTDVPGREIYLSNGKITYQSNAFNPNFGGPDQRQELFSTNFSGSRNLADGQWHHIVIRPFSGFTGTGTEIWVDGTFEVRRYFAGEWLGMPDYVGGTPGIPTSQYLLGDMSEIVFYEKNVGHDDISRNYYAFMGWSPISVEPIELSVAMPDGRGRGNQKRALYLYWSDEPEVFKDSGGQFENFSPDAIDFDPMTGFVMHNYPPFNSPGGDPLAIGDYHGFKVFARPITTNGRGAAYRDPFTDEPSLINLETDVDLGDYDVIMFKDWPDESGPRVANQIELDFVEYTFPGQKERLLRQLREANDAGIGLYVTNPRLAVDLGIVDRVEFVPTLKESRFANQGNAGGLYDYGSAVKFPWNIVASDGLQGGQGVGAAGTGVPMITDPTYLGNKAFFYSDTNKNDRFRVRALVENLTDIPSYMIKDVVYHVDYDIWGWQDVAYKYLHAEDGLQIGDEYIFNGTDLGGAIDSARYGRTIGTFATPMANVKAGTVVTTFGAKHWWGTEELDNPYKDYATTIILEPGDNLTGRPVGGKIFVNFTESPSYGLGLAVQVLPDSEHDVNNNVEWPFGYNPDTSEQREWEWSWTRKSLTDTNQNNSTSVTITLAGGQTAVIPVAGEGATLTMTRSSNLFPIIGKPRWEMDGRGMFWLSVKDEVNEGDVTIRATAMTASVSMPEPEVVAERDVVVAAESMLSTLSMPKVAEDETGDVDIITLPMRAHFDFTGYSTVISAEPMTMHIELVENFNLVHATGEQVVLYLHGVDVTLFIKEEA